MGKCKLILGICMIKLMNTYKPGKAWYLNRVIRMFLAEMTMWFWVEWVEKSFLQCGWAQRKQNRKQRKENVCIRTQSSLAFEFISLGFISLLPQLYMQSQAFGMEVQIQSYTISLFGSEAFRFEWATMQSCHRL